MKAQIRDNIRRQLGALEDHQGGGLGGDPGRRSDPAKGVTMELSTKRASLHYQRMATEAGELAREFETASKEIRKSNGRNADFTGRNFHMMRRGIFLLEDLLTLINYQDGHQARGSSGEDHQGRGDLAEMGGT